MTTRRCIPYDAVCYTNVTYRYSVLVCNLQCNVHKLKVQYTALHGKSIRNNVNRTRVPYTSARNDHVANNVQYVCITVLFWSVFVHI